MECVAKYKPWLKGLALKCLQIPILQGEFDAVGQCFRYISERFTCGAFIVTSEVK